MGRNQKKREKITSVRSNYRTDVNNNPSYLRHSVTLRRIARVPLRFTTCLCSIVPSGLAKNNAIGRYDKAQNRQLFVFVVLHYVHTEIEERNEEEYYHYVGHGVTHNGSHPNATNQTKEAADGGNNPNDSTELIHGKRVF